MGITFRSHTLHIFISFLLLIACFLMVACGVEQPEFDPSKILTALPGYQASGTNNTGQGGPPEDNEIAAKIHCPDVRRDDCNVQVTVNPVKGDVELDIQVYADHGIQFIANLDAGALPGENNEVHSIKLLSGESRNVNFPYQPNIVSGVQSGADVPNLPGAFKIDVIATHSGTSTVYGKDTIYTFMWLDEYGEFHLLQSEEIYNNKFKDSFVEGDLGLGYSLILEEAARPRKGHIWVRTDSMGDNYNSLMEIASTEAVTFLEDPIWGHDIGAGGSKAIVNFPPINNDGARIARIPFELDRNGRLLDGRYVFMVKLRNEDTNLERHERLPVILELHSDPQYPDERWFVPIVAPAVAATSTPVGATGGIGTETVLRPANFNADQMCEELKNVRFDVGVVNEILWTREIANYEGDLCDAYLEFVAFRVPISWNDFEEDMLLANKNLNHPDDMLMTYETYIVPELDK